MLKFVDAGTTAIEFESGAAVNEPTTYAVRIAIEQAVLDMIAQGLKRGLWSYRNTTPKEETSRSADEVNSSAIEK
jgi:curli biogenesis system outer membrane secretion channel CsgG